MAKGVSKELRQMALLSRFTSKKSRRKVALRLGLPMLATIGVCTYSYVQYGFTLWMLFLASIVWASYLYHSFGLRILSPINFQLLFPTGIGLWVSFHLWDPTEHLPFGTDMEYPHLAGLAFGMAVGMLVVLVKASDDDEGTLLRAIRAMRHYLVVMSVVAVAGYALFIPYAFAMYQVFTEGNHIFGLLAAMIIIAFLAFAHNQAKAPTTD